MRDMPKVSPDRHPRLYALVVRNVARWDGSFYATSTHDDSDVTLGSEPDEVECYLIAKPDPSQW